LPPLEPLRGPRFGSYLPEDVGWLLTDLSSVALEGDIAAREAEIQAGRRHYSETLPIEYRPSNEYLLSFRHALARHAPAVARAVAVLGERILLTRGRAPVLVSLARAGTPVGVLLRRYLRDRHRIEAPHYAVSIILGKGLDPVAVRWLLARHRPADIVFVDGWTGKGAIASELKAAAAAYRASGIALDAGLAVLADPGGCASVYGTRRDLLVPSACLNSTVSGLVSRTVHAAHLIGADTFHGAKCYHHLASEDRSTEFLDAVTEHFDRPDGVDLPEPPDWRGRRAVVDLVQRGWGPPALLKPGVCEAIRVLLRRLPAEILVQDLQSPDVEHLLLLAADRKVPVRVDSGLPFVAVGVVARRP
jgi:hypothetical protein